MHDQQQQITMCILYLALRPQISNLLLLLLCPLNIFKRHRNSCIKILCVVVTNNQRVETS